MQYRHILAIRAGALGDTLVSFPALGRLRRAVGPNGSVELVGREPYVELALDPRLACAVHAFDRGVFAALFARSGGAAELDRFLARFDLVVSWSKLPLLANRLDRLGVRLLSAPPMPPPGVHAIDHLVSTLVPLGLGGECEPAALVAGPEGRRQAQTFLRRHGLAPGRFVAIHPSSGDFRKNWPERSFGELARIARREGPGLVWIQGEADARAVRQALADAPGPTLEGASLQTLAALLSMAFGFVGNDSGVSHLAAAVGAPTIAIFRSTDPRQWAPRGRASAVLDWRISPREVWGFAVDFFRRHFSFEVNRLAVERGEAREPL